MIYLDADCFKAINDRYGHDVGDEVLRPIATTARQCGAPVGRLGGDEFSVILADHSLPGALRTASTTKQRISDARLQTPEAQCAALAWAFQTGDKPNDLMKRADLALYQAKHSGGNCVATTPKASWMNQRPHLGVSLVRLLGAAKQTACKRGIAYTP